MNITMQIFKWLFRQSLCLYPASFRVEFGAEMQSVFAKTLADKSGFHSALLLLRELGDLPGTLVSI